MDVTHYSSYLKTVPINPAIATKVLEMVENQEYSFKRLEELVSVDPGLTSKILKIANSAMYARQNKVTKLQNAMTLLGINTIKNVVILVTGASMFKQKVGSPFYTLFWRHSLATAFIAKDLASKIGIPKLGEEAFIAGLLHNVGQVALYLHDPAGYESLVAEVVRDGRRFSELELAKYGATHKEIGSEVLSQWNFPEVFPDCSKEHGNANITSSWKKVVLVVSAAAFIAGNWTYFSELPKPYALLDPLLVHLDSSASAIEAYQEEYRVRLEKDAFYQECQNLLKG